MVPDDVHPRAFLPLGWLTLRAWAWLDAHPAATPGCWVALFGDELLAVMGTFGELMRVVKRTPLPGTAMVYQIPQPAPRTSPCLR